MRWILILLLMCNGLYFYWQNIQQQNIKPVEAVGDLAGGKRLLLLSEFEAEGGVIEGSVAVQSVSPVSGEVEPIVVPEEPEPIEEPDSDICWQVGEMPELVSARQVRDRLQAIEADAEIIATTIAGKPDFWVHIAPLPSRKLAVAKLRELQAKKIDSFLITEGELANGISLGFFSSRDRAMKVFEARREAGWEAEMKVVPRERRQIWLLLKQSDYKKIGEAFWQQIKKENKALQRRKNSCESIASAEKLA